MANWVLKCPNCNSDFANSPIKEDTLAEFFFASKPPFSNGGKTLDCPNCGTPRRASRTSKYTERKYAI